MVIDGAGDGRVSGRALRVVAVWVLAVAAATGGCSDGGDHPEGAGQGGPEASADASGDAGEEPPPAVDPATTEPARVTLAPAAFDVRLAGAVGSVMLAGGES